MSSSAVFSQLATECLAAAFVAKLYAAFLEVCKSVKQATIRELPDQSCTLV